MKISDILAFRGFGISNLYSYELYASFGLQLSNEIFRIYQTPHTCHLDYKPRRNCTRSSSRLPTKSQTEIFSLSYIQTDLIMDFVKQSLRDTFLNTQLPYKRCGRHFLYLILVF